MFTNTSNSHIKIGIAGLGAIGGAVARALTDTGTGGIDGLTLECASEINPSLMLPYPSVSYRRKPGSSDPSSTVQKDPGFRRDDSLGLDYVDFAGLAERCDLIVECLPAAAVPALARECFARDKNMVIVSAAALLVFPEIMDQQRSTQSRIYVPSGAIAGLDGVQALAQAGIESAGIATTKPPGGYAGAPYIVQNAIDLKAIKTRTRIFSGNALEAARAFPANINVAATLSLAGIGPERTTVEIWADPAARGNGHEITVRGRTSTITTRVENTPDPANPKSSLLAAHSVIALLKGLTAPLVVL